MKIVVNRCYGGFGLSAYAVKRYNELKGLPTYFYIQTKYEYKDKVAEYTQVSESEADKHGFLICSTIDNGKRINNYPDGYFSVYDIERTDPLLIQVVEELGDKANGEYAKLQVVEIPDDVKWYISEYDGIERIEEEHRIW